MEEWKIYKIGELCKIHRGASPRPIQKYLSENGQPWVKISDATADTSRYITSTKEFIIEEGIRHSVIVTPGTLIVSNSATPGLPKIMKIEACVHDGWLIIDQIKDCVLKEYLYYSFINIRRNLSNQANGSVFQNLKTEIVNNYEIRLPSISTQRKIVNFLSSLEDKIDLNNSINHNLEQQTQALYKSWFVDFEPFRGEKFVKSELGSIPSSLKIKQISEVAHILETGKRPKGGVGDLSSGIPSIGAESIKGLGFFDSSKVKFISEDFASTLKKGWIDGYELLIYKDGGKPGYFVPNYNIFGEGFPYDRMCLNEHVFKLDFKDRGLNAFAYFYFHSEYVFNYLNAQGGKAAIPGINQKDIESLWIYDPNNESVQLFAEKVSPLITTILINCKNNMKLSAMRDMILPKLMSGELKINDCNC